MDNIDSETKVIKKLKKKRKIEENEGDQNVSNNEKLKKKRKQIAMVEPVEPTRKELLDSIKPENIRDKNSKRSKKRDKYKKKIENSKIDNTERDIERNSIYLKKWNDNRDEWKFEKQRQISIQKCIFDDNHFDEDLWPIAVEYLSGSKGKARDDLLKRAEDIISKGDLEAENNADIDLNESSIYRKARELLQMIN